MNILPNKYAACRHVARHYAYVDFTNYQKHANCNIKRLDAENTHCNNTNKVLRFGR